MGDAFLLLITALIGVVCGATFIGGALVGFAWWRSMTEKRQPLPPLPTKLYSSPNIDAYATIPPDSFQRPQMGAFPPPNTGMPWLDGVGGMVAGQRIKIDRPETLIGRSRVCDVQFHDPKVSRQHAVIRLYNGHYFVQDMQSSRGTLVNNVRVESHMLRDGDEIRLGDSVVIFRTPP